MGAGKSSQLAKPESEIHEKLSGCYRYQPKDGKEYKPIRETSHVYDRGTGHVLKPGEVFSVAKEVEGEDGTIFMQLADGRGWVCDQTPGRSAIFVPQDTSLWQYTPQNGLQKSLRYDMGHSSAKSQNRLRPGELFHVREEVLGEDGITHLKLADGRGWAFERHPEDGPMCVRVGGQPASTNGGYQTQAAPRGAEYPVERIGEVRRKLEGFVQQKNDEPTGSAYANQTNVMELEAQLAKKDAVCIEQQHIIDQLNAKIVELERRVTMSNVTSGGYAMPANTSQSTYPMPASTSQSTYPMPASMSQSTIPIVASSRTQPTTLSQHNSILQSTSPPNTALPSRTLRPSLTAQSIPVRTIPTVTSLANPPSYRSPTPQDSVSGSTRSFDFRGVQRIA